MMETTVLNIINISLGSISILVVAAAVISSLLLKLGEIPHEALLRVLGDSGETVPSSCEDDSASQVDSTAHAKILIVILINTILTHIYRKLYFTTKLKIELPSFCIFSVVLVLKLPSPARRITPDGEAQLA